MKLAKHAQWLIAVCAVGALPAFAFAAETKKPRLELRGLPALGSPSTEFLFVADLKGGADSEDFYCPTLAWQWGKEEDASVQEPECEPFKAGVTRIERRFSQSRRFADEGPRSVTLVLSKNGKILARATASVRVTWEKSGLKGSVR